MLTLLAYVTYRDVGNADNAGAIICPCRQSFAGSGAERHSTAQPKDSFDKPM
jgi:hypothetical protein